MIKKRADRPMSNLFTDFFFLFFHATCCLKVYSNVAKVSYLYFQVSQN
jgi:hypothetical protein